MNPNWIAEVNEPMCLLVNPKYSLISVITAFDENQTDVQRNCETMIISNTLVCLLKMLFLLRTGSSDFWFVFAQNIYIKPNLVFNYFYSCLFQMVPIFWIRFHNYFWFLNDYVMFHTYWSKSHSHSMIFVSVKV